MDLEDNVRRLSGCAQRSADAGIVAAVRDQLPAEPEVTRLAELFRLLGDPTRVRILLVLLEAGELCVCDVAAAAGASETTVSHALRLLRMAAVVRSRRDGRRIMYALDDAHVRLLLDLTGEHLRHQGGVAPAGRPGDRRQR